LRRSTRGASSARLLLLLALCHACAARSRDIFFRYVRSRLGPLLRRLVARRALRCRCDICRRGRRRLLCLILHCCLRPLLSCARSSWLLLLLLRCLSARLAAPRSDTCVAVRFASASNRDAPRLLRRR
jgi:hypothetical protein